MPSQTGCVKTANARYPLLLAPSPFQGEGWGEVSFRMPYDDVFRADVLIAGSAVFHHTEGVAAINWLGCWGITCLTLVPFLARENLRRASEQRRKLLQEVLAPSTESGKGRVD